MPQGSALRGYVKRDRKVSNHPHRSTVPQASRFNTATGPPVESPQRVDPHRGTFDTDVESIGDSTTFSLAGTDGRTVSGFTADAGWNGDYDAENGVRYAHHAASLQELQSLSRMTASQMLGERGKDAYTRFMQGNTTQHLRQESAPPSPRLELDPSEQLPNQSGKTSPRPVSIRSRYSQADDGDSPKTEHSASPTPRRRPIVPRTSLQDSGPKKPPPAFAVTKKRANEATAQAFLDASHQLHADESADEDEDPFTEPTRLNHTNTNVSDISASSGGQSRMNKDLDYDYDDLVNMPYSELAAQPFDLDPRLQTDSASTKNFSAEEIAVELDRMRTQPAESTQIQRERFRTFFAQLDIDQHETAGDVIMDRLMSVLNGLKQIRRDKRAAATEIEKQVADRESAVREKQETLAQSTDWLKKQGQGVIKGPR